MISSLTYFFVLDLPPTNHGYITSDGYPAVLVSVGPVYLTVGELQETNFILTSIKTTRYKMVREVGFEPTKA